MRRAVVHDGDAVAEGLRLLHVVSRVEDGDAVLAVQLTDALEDVVAGLGIDADGGLVEEEDAGFVEQADGEIGAARHAAGVAADRDVGPGAEGDDLEYFIDALLQEPSLRGRTCGRRSEGCRER